MFGVHDVFTLIRRATELLPEHARAENGALPDDVRDCQRAGDWELALDLLLRIGESHSVPVDFWRLLTESARQLRLTETAAWCVLRDHETRHGTVRARLSLLPTSEGGRRTPIPGDGRLRPLWNIGNHTPGGEWSCNLAWLWLEGLAKLSPGHSATVRLAPLSPEQWRHLAVGDAITMHESRPPVGVATITELTSPVVPGPPLTELDRIPATRPSISREIAARV
ncbi:hypothetical protein ACOQFL_15270 [Actinopolyspora sp. H202]|uniref:hypothetical protein n=1 Tax=Actinopolyspora sp. H202 TaxID=1500456 RepID=UPI003EE58F54